MGKRLFYGILIFVLSIGIGYYYSSLWKKENSLKDVSLEYKNEIQETYVFEEKVRFDAVLSLKKYYSKCGHCKVNQVELPKEFINLTEKELKEIYSDWNVEVFNNREVVLGQNINSMCEEHYVLRLGKENVEIYRMEGFNDLYLLKTTDITREYLTKTDIVNLEEGIFIYGNGNLNSALEDFE